MLGFSKLLLTGNGAPLEKGRILDGTTYLESFAYFNFPFVKRPLLQSFSELTNSINQAKNTLDESIRSFGWKWMVLCVGIALGVIVFVSLVVWSSLWYQENQINALIAQKASLQMEVTELQGNVDKLAKKGGRIKLERCGTESRLCVEITPNQGKGMEDFHGSWQGNKDNRRFVIPMGY